MAENPEQDEDEEHAPEPFRGEEALAKAREGPDAWNAWAEENPGREVNFFGADFTDEANEDISFEGFTFPGKVGFSAAKFLTAHFDGAIFNEEANFFRAHFAEDTYVSGAVFEGEVDFSQSVFEGPAWIDGTTFMGNAHFSGTSFNADAGFHKATFEDFADFNGATFSGPVYLHDSRFRIVPDFRGTDFKTHVTLNGMEVDFRRPAGSHDADMYRRLKELAVTARDHDREQEFFAYELMAKRGHETNGLRLIPNYLYECFSNFGRSLTLPSFWLISVWFMFGIFYRWLETADTINHIWDGLSFSAASLFPFLGASRGALGDARKALYGEEALSTGINALAMLEGGLGILFLFLIGLALRNRFRL